jgi:hypothetical protein
MVNGLQCTRVLLSHEIPRAIRLTGENLRCVMVRLAWILAVHLLVHSHHVSGRQVPVHQRIVCACLRPAMAEPVC